MSHDPLVVIKERVKAEPEPVFIPIHIALANDAFLAPSGSPLLIRQVVCGKRLNSQRSTQGTEHTVNWLSIVFN